MKLRRVQVHCYAGGRADEYPRRVVVDGLEYTVARLLCSSIEEDPKSKERRHRFTVRTEEGIVLEVVKASDDHWYLDQVPVLRTGTQFPSKRAPNTSRPSKP